jgi:hypothetical protein
MADASPVPDAGALRLGGPAYRIEDQKMGTFERIASREATGIAHTFSASRLVGA